MPERSKHVTYRALRRTRAELRHIAESCTLGLGKVRKECSSLRLCRTSLEVRGLLALQSYFVLTDFKIHVFPHSVVNGCYMSGYICHHICWAQLNVPFSIMLSSSGRFRSANTIRIHSFVREDKSILWDHQTARKTPRIRNFHFQTLLAAMNH